MTLFLSRPVSTGAAPVKAARYAALKAKKEEAKMLLAIAEETEKRESAANEALETSKKAARQLMEKGQSVGGTLAEVHAVASAWTNRGRSEVAGKSQRPVGNAAVPTPMEEL